MVVRRRRERVHMAGGAVTLHIRECDDRGLHPRQREQVNEKLAEVAALVRACGIPESFQAQLSAPLHRGFGADVDFELRIGWEHMCVGVILSGWEWSSLSADDRITRVDYFVRGACIDLLKGVMADRRECYARAKAGA